MENGIYAKITTEKGEILISLEYKLTPITVSNFIGLSSGTLSNHSNKKNTRFYEDTTIRKIRSDIFHTREYGDPEGGFVVGIHREGHLKDMIIKAQSMSGAQLKKFIETNFSAIGD